MADGIESFSEKRNVARVLAGWKGGPFYQGMILPKPMRFVDGITGADREKLQGQSYPQPPMQDPWGYRRNNAKL